jgi:hypothetical protein
VQTPCATPVTGCAGTGNGTGGFVPTSPATAPLYNYYGTGAGMNANIFYGTINPAQPNAVNWVGIPIDAPGTNYTRVIRITNIRINAYALGVGTPTSPPVQALAFISVTPTTALPITNNAQQVVGNVVRSLEVSADDVIFQQCLSPVGIPEITFTELVASAFKVRVAGTPPVNPTAITFQDIPGGLYNTESGFYSAATGAAGLADTGTRLKAVLKNIPLDATLSVPSVITNGSLVAVLVGSETSASPYPTIGTSASTAVSLTTAGGVQAGTVVYEIVASNPQQFETLTVPVTVDFTPNPSASPGLGTATVNASYAPIASDSQSPRASATLPIPRFVDTSTAADIFAINVCATNLLFPFVTNQVGFDTGLAIANTTEDAPVYDTTPQEGVCTLYPFGENSGNPVVSPTIAAVTVWTALASVSMQNFQGYVIAHCTFQFAHGFAFVSDLGARNLAMGYLALVIPDTGVRLPNPNAISGANSGEQLNQ